jgi:hypothetical protein
VFTTGGRDINTLCVALVRFLVVLAVEKMDGRFPVWIHLRLESQENIDKIIRTLTRMFADTTLLLTVDTFTSDRILESFIKRYAMRNSTLDASDDEDDGNDDGMVHVDHDGEQEEEGVKRGYAFMAHDMKALGYYAEFLGRSFACSESFIQKIGLITKYAQQSDVSIRIQDNANTLLLVEDIRTKLCQRQTAINARIARWLHLGNLAESRTSLQHFGTNELQPYIELCLRYLFLPMHLSRLKNMRMVLKTLPPHVNEAYHTDARLAMFALPNKTSAVPDVVFLNGDHLTHVSMVYPDKVGRTKTHGRLVARDIGQTLSVYMFFCFKYCPGNPNTVTKLSKEKEDSRLFFTQNGGGDWRYLMRQVRAYAKQIHLKVDQMGLTQNTSSYMHQSRVTWVASRAHTTPRPLPQLDPIPEALYPLWLEMQQKTGNNPVFPPGISPVPVDTLWIKIEEDDRLYSDEYKTCMGKAKSVVQFVQ